MHAGPVAVETVFASGVELKVSLSLCTRGISTFRGYFQVGLNCPRSEVHDTVVPAYHSDSVLAKKDGKSHDMRHPESFQ